MLQFIFDFSMNIFSEHVIERTDLPKQLIKDVSGEYILDQTQPKVSCRSVFCS